MLYTDFLSAALLVINCNTIVYLFSFRNFNCVWYVEPSDDIKIHVFILYIRNFLEISLIRRYCCSYHLLLLLFCYSYILFLYLFLLHCSLTEIQRSNAWSKYLMLHLLFLIFFWMEICYHLSVKSFHVHCQFDNLLCFQDLPQMYWVYHSNNCLSFGSFIICQCLSIWNEIAFRCTGFNFIVKLFFSLALFLSHIYSSC